MDHEILLRITLIQPPSDVTFCVQRGKSDLVPPVQMTDRQIAFDLSVRVEGSRPEGAPRLLGPFAQGPVAGRFVYISSGTLAGQPDSCWTRRAKVPLSGISWALIQEALGNPAVVIAARIAGTAKDGGPACATVPLLDPGWSVVPTSSIDDVVYSGGGLPTHRPA